MQRYEISDIYLFIKSDDKVTITSVVPTDDAIFVISDVAAAMFLALIEKKLSFVETVDSIEMNYAAERAAIETDLLALIKYLSDEKIILEVQSA